MHNSEDVHERTKTVRDPVDTDDQVVKNLEECSKSSGRHADTNRKVKEVAEDIKKY